MGKLYLVPTPLGNLADFTYRAVNVLGEVDLILAEDTRTSTKLLNHYNISRPLQSFHMHNEHKKLERIISQLNYGKTIAMISDAGTPGISDPGFLLVREAIANNIEVICLPGPTALIPALVQSGFPTERFIFEGFLPPKKGRKTRLEQLSQDSRTIVFYESPHKLIKTLTQLITYFQGERQVAISREMTKIYEETYRGTLEEAVVHFNKKGPKGEFVVCISGNQTK
jgi:16S rRNA (cytidine1402-2'-O)-methyltransferase